MKFYPGQEFIFRGLDDEIGPTITVLGISVAGSISYRIGDYRQSNVYSVEYLTAKALVEDGIWWRKEVV